MEPEKKITLRKLRKQQKISLHEMAKALGCAANMISSMEYGSRPIGELWARRFADFFGVEDWKQFLNEITK